MSPRDWQTVIVSSWRHVAVEVMERYFFPAAVVLVAVAAAAVYFLFWRPYQVIRSGEDQTVNLSANLTALEDLQRRLRNAEARAIQRRNVAEADLKRFAIALPTDVAETELMVELEALMQAAGVELQDLAAAAPLATTTERSVTPSPTADTEQTALDQRTVTLRGSLSFIVTDYEQLKRTTAMIEQNLRLLDIGSLTYSPETGAVTLSVTAYSTVATP